MLLRSFMLQTIRALYRGVIHQSGLVHDDDVLEAAASHALNQWSTMREPYQSACLLAMGGFRIFTRCITRKSLLSLDPANTAKTIDRWNQLPTNLPSDSLRAMTLFFVMAAFDHPAIWEQQGLPERASYQELVRAYHDIQGV